MSEAESITHAASAAPRAQRASCLMRYVRQRAWVHLLLIAGTALFLFPFYWMLSTSLKTDDELAEARIAPTIPLFRPQSPYIREMEEPAAPEGVSAERWQTLRPAISGLAEATLKSVQESSPKSMRLTGISAEEHRRQAARWLVGRLVARMNLKLWAGPEPAILDDFRRLLEASKGNDVDAALSQSLARLEITATQLRTLAYAQIFSDGRDYQGTWTVESGAGMLVAVPGAVRLDYRFAGSNDAPVILRYEFTGPAYVEPQDLHKLTIAIHADDSWHRVDATLDWGASRWQSQRTTYIVQHRPLSITFQPPSFDDTTYRNRTWVPIEAVSPRLDGKQPTAMRQDGRQLPVGTLRLIISPSSTIAANVGKIQRNYLRAFWAVPFWTYVVNSLLLVGLTVGGAVLSASFVAYAFARLNWPGRSLAFIILLATMMLPAQVTMIPSFMIWKAVGWYNTLNPMWVPAWFGSAFFIFLMTQHMRTIPRELEEAARLDGLNAVQIWWYIMLPHVTPTLAAIAIITFMGAWNEFMGPLIYLRDQSKFPLSLGLFGMRVDQGAVSDWTMMMAGNMLMTLPVIVIFFIFQRYFIQGMTMTGIKA